MRRFYLRLHFLILIVNLWLAAAVGSANTCDPSLVAANMNKWRDLYADTSWRIRDEKAIEQHNGYGRQRGKIVVEGNGGVITSRFVYYKPATASKTPLIFLYSGLVGINPLDHLVARHLAKRGIAVVISHDLDLNMAENIKSMPGALIRTIGVGKALTDYFASRSAIDSARLAVFGYSYGGLRAYHQMAIDPRLKAAVLIGAGSPMSDVLAFSRLSVVELIRGWQMFSSGFTSVSDYRAALQAQTDVVSESELACAHPAADYYLFISQQDTWTPTFTQWQLWEALGRPRHEVVLVGHVSTVLAAVASRLDAMISFFQQRWQKGRSMDAPSAG